MNNNEIFRAEDFLSPDISFAPCYVWVWNDTVTEEIIESQLREMKELGIRAFYILAEPRSFRPDSMPTNLSPDYLTEEFFSLVSFTAERAKKLGMMVWIYDEGGWPSGGASGKVLEKCPEYAREVLSSRTRAFRAGEAYEKSSPSDFAAFINDSEIIREGHIFREDCTVTEYFSEKRISSPTDYPDLLKKEAAECFIETTHKKYEKALENELGTTVTALFTDEPKAPSGAFSKELSDKYEKLYKESVLPYLPLIAGKTAPTRENEYILHRWYDLLSRTFCESFLLTCKKWANEQGLSFTGHLDKDHHPLGCIRGGENFQLMRSLRCFDIPGIDVIWRQVYPEGRTDVRDEMNAYNGYFPRYASSAATQNGNKRVLAEIFGVAGASLTYDIMRYTAGFLAVRGINLFNIFNFPLGRSGHLLAQELPVFTEEQPYLKNLKDFNRYLERLSFVSSLGEAVCDTALYYPVRDFWGKAAAEKMSDAFDKLGRGLEEKNQDFDIIDSDIIENAELSRSGELIFGNARYRKIIIPEGAFLSEKEKAVLEAFGNYGGRVFYGLSEICDNKITDKKGILTKRRRFKNGELILVFCEKGEDGAADVHLSCEVCYLLELMSGKIIRKEAENRNLSLELYEGETAVILISDEKLPCEENKAFESCCAVIENFRLRRDTELIFSEEGFHSIKHCEEGIPAGLCGWKDFIGEAFTGSCIYEAEFTLPSEKKGEEGEIDLGDVRFSASVRLNGTSLGDAVFPPYRIKIPKGLLEEENRLEIKVTNTAANLYLNTDYFDKYTINELSPYFIPEKEFARAYVSGGLFSSVKLFMQ